MGSCGANPWYGVPTAVSARAALPEGDVLIVDAMGSCWTPMRWPTLWSWGEDLATACTTPGTSGPWQAHLVGPEVGRFAEVVALRSTGALSVCGSPSALHRAIQTALQDVEASRRAGAKAAAYAQENAGAGMAIAQRWSNAL